MESPNNFNNLEFFDKHEQGLMNEAEAADFKQRLKTEKDLAQEYKEYQQVLREVRKINELGYDDIRATVNAVSRKLKEEGFFQKLEAEENSLIEAFKNAHDIREEVDGVHKKLKSEGFFEKAEKEVGQPVKTKKTIVRRMNAIRRVLAVAASLVLLVVAYWWFGGENDKRQLVGLEKESFKIANNFFSKNQGWGGTSDSISLQMMEVLEKLGNDDIEGALELLENLKAKYGPENTRMRYLISLALYKQKKYQEVVEILKPLLENDNLVVRQSGRWFTALSFVRLGEKPNAKEILQALLSESPSDETVELQQAAKILLSSF